jgi:hypothetical protein
MCRKISYSSQWSAKRALRGLRRAHPDRTENGVHPCRECHAWHLTSHARGRKRMPA